MSAVLIANDIRIQFENEGECLFMDTLGLLFDKDNNYCQELEGEVVRDRVIDAFQTQDGFIHVVMYLSSGKFPLTTSRSCHLDSHCRRLLRSWRASLPFYFRTQ